MHAGCEVGQSRGECVLGHKGKSRVMRWLSNARSPEKQTGHAEMEAVGWA